MGFTVPGWGCSKSIILNEDGFLIWPDFNLKYGYLTWKLHNYFSDLEQLLLEDHIWEYLR